MSKQLINLEGLKIYHDKVVNALYEKADKTTTDKISEDLISLDATVKSNQNTTNQAITGLDTMVKSLNENKVTANTLLDTPLSLSAPLVTYYNVGKITDASSTHPVTFGTNGDSLRDIFNNLFNMNEIQPTIKDYPSVSCSLSYTGDERGTKISSVSYTITFYDGNYTYETTTGVKMTSYSFLNGEASSTTLTSGTLNLPSTYTVGESSAFSTTLTAQYSDGNIAKTNLGNDSSNPVVQIKASSCTATPSFSKTAVDYPYYVSSSYSTVSELIDNGVDFARKSTNLSKETGEKCQYNSDCYVWMFIRKGDTITQPDKTIETYSTIASDWGKLLGGTEKMGTITFEKANGVTDTFFAYRTIETAQSGAEFKLRIYRKVN